ncbi:MAG: glycosyltransferase family 2 protein [Anaerolineae bacterium]|nr:glycosyltransferase family 2 protein [Anaerolineae bacterium]
MSTLSVVINVYNEGHLLKDCLDSVRWADEIVITDMYSTDNSAEVYLPYASKSVLIDWEPIADRVHHVGFAQATGDWVLKLDPDERVSPALAQQIQEVVASPATYAAYRLPFKDYMFGKWIRYTGWQGNREVGLIRLFQRSQVTWQTEVHSQPVIDGEVGAIQYNKILDNTVDHINYTSVAQFMEKLNRYTTAESEKRFAEGKNFRWPKLLYHPLVEIWNRYVRAKGYKDGMHGFVLSLLMAFYVELVLIKMWETTLHAAKNGVVQE